MAALIVAGVALALAHGWAALATGVAFWGLHMGMTQGLLATMVADTAPPELRGTAYGVFNLASGVAMLVASAVAGGMWSAFGASATFWGGAGFASLCLAVVAARGPRGRGEITRGGRT